MAKAKEGLNLMKRVLTHNTLLYRGLCAPADLIKKFSSDRQSPLFESTSLVQSGGVSYVNRLFRVSGAVFNIPNLVQRKIAVISNRDAMTGMDPDEDNVGNVYADIDMQQSYPVLSES